MVIQKIVTDTFYVGITVEMETNRVAIRVQFGMIELKTVTGRTIWKKMTRVSAHGDKAVFKSF